MSSKNPNFYWQVIIMSSSPHDDVFLLSPNKVSSVLTNTIQILVESWNGCLNFFGIWAVGLDKIWNKVMIPPNKIIKVQVCNFLERFKKNQANSIRGKYDIMWLNWYQMSIMRCQMSTRCHYSAWVTCYLPSPTHN